MSAVATNAADPTQDLHPRAKEVLDFWFGPSWPTASPTWMSDTGPSLWFSANPEGDAKIKEKFGQDCENVVNGAYDDWINAGPHQSLAAIIIGDQLSRNVYRGTPKMYAADEKIYQWAKTVVACGADKQLLPIQRQFIYLPFMHVEDLDGQNECVKLYQELAKECAAIEGGEELAKFAASVIDYAILHRDIVAKYGRFPHRNVILGRENTEEETKGFAENSIASF